MDRAALSECGDCDGRSISKIASADRQIDRVCSSHLSQADGGRAIVGGSLFSPPIRIKSSSSTMIETLQSFAHPTDCSALSLSSDWHTHLAALRKI